MATQVTNSILSDSIVKEGIVGVPPDRILSGESIAMSTLDKTYARSAAGRKKLVNDLKSDIGRAKAAFTGEKLTDVTNVVKRYWKGADADKFCSELSKKAKDAAKACDKYVTTIEASLNADASSFDKMQQTNASSIASLK